VQVVEPVAAIEEFAQDERRPPFGEDLSTERDWAELAVGGVHAARVLLRRCADKFSSCTGVRRVSRHAAAYVDRSRGLQVQHGAAGSGWWRGGPVLVGSPRLGGARPASRALVQNLHYPRDVHPRDGGSQPFQTLGRHRMSRFKVLTLLALVAAGLASGSTMTASAHPSGHVLHLTGHETSAIQLDLGPAGGNPGD